MKRALAFAALAVLAATSCGSGDDQAASSTTAPSPVTSTTSPVATSTTAPGATTIRPTSTTTSSGTSAAAAKAVIEPAAVAGIPLGANKAQAIAVLGQPTTSGQETDLSGKKYDFLKWQLSGNRGLTLNFRTESATSPLLTDWNANAPGPLTNAGVQVGDSAAKAVAGHGALQAFCCESKVASVVQGGGRMIVVVSDATQKVTGITGGDPAYWSRSIAD